MGHDGLIMTVRTDALLGRAKDWYAEDRDIVGLVLYGSAATGRTHDTSDVDLVVVTRPGCRDQVWARRHTIAERLLDQEPAWSHELPWQGDYRFQAWRSDLLGVDLTFDDSVVGDHETFATGQPIVIAGRLTIPPTTGPDRTEPIRELDLETWIWFLGIHNQLRQGRAWDGYVQLINLLDTRVRPIMEPAELTELLPSSIDRDTLLEMLDTVVSSYRAATHRLCISTDNPLPERIHGVIRASAGREP